MRAITVRNGLGQLICFGPADGMYKPGIPLGCTQQVEPDYDVVCQEWITRMALIPQPKTIEERLSALEARNG